MVEVGNTPLVEVEGKYFKLECTNPCGSIKDRIGLYIIEESEKRGLLKKGSRIIEAPSGNTGITLTYFAKQKGYPITIVMPENMSEERKEIMRDLGADLILCSEEGSFAEAAAIRDRLTAEHGYFNTDQFSNPLNVECHYRTTAAEILRQIKEFGRSTIDAFVAGVGTGGTLIGITKRLREKFPDIFIAAVEPSESAVMSGGPSGSHGIPGIGDGFIPAIASDGNEGLHPFIDEVITVDTKDARTVADMLMDTHGYCVGISSGANFIATEWLQKKFETIVSIFPDSYGRYKSSGLKHCRPGHCEYEHDPVV